VSREKEEITGLDNVEISFLEPRPIINLGCGIDPKKEDQSIP